MRKALFGAAAGLFVSGCAVTVDVPANRFDSPETLGKQWRVKVQGDYGGSNSVELTPLLSSTTPDTASPGYATTRFIRASGGVELFQNLDVELKSLTEIAVKYQFLGEPKLVAREGNFSMAVTASTGFTSSKDAFTPLFEKKTVANDQNEYFFDGALIAGIRVEEHVLFYFGPFVRNTNFSGKFTVSPSSGGTTSSQYSGTVLTTGGNVGIEAGTQLFQIKLEAAYANVKSGSLNTGRLFSGVSVAFQFGKH